MKLLKENPKWAGLPFHPMSAGYKKRFGHKIQTVPVSIASDCPNRRGLKGMQVCVFCDEWGSSAYPDWQNLNIKKQIENGIQFLGPKYHSKNFLVYFQAYTSTFLDFETLRLSIEEALQFHQVQGVVIGTRPDCLSKSVLDYLADLAKKTYVSIEMGVQSFFEDQVEFLKRGHTAEESRKAIRKVKEKIPDLELGIHLMFGLPGETDEHVIETARIASDLPVDHVKLHNLHVLKNTPLEKMFHSGAFSPIELSEYSARVVLFLKHLDPRIRIQRLGAVASRWNELVAPRWTTYKMRTYQYIIDQMNDQNAFQGQLYVPMVQRPTSQQNLYI